MHLTLPALLLLAASTALPTLAHADRIDDFVLTGNGHTYTFSLPSTGRVGGEPQYGITGRVRFYQSASSATVDGLGGYEAGATFIFYPGPYGTVQIGVQPQGTFAATLNETLFGPALVDYNQIQDPAGFLSFTAFHRYGTFDLTTFTFSPGGPIRTPYTLTITPEATNTSTPEPTPLALLLTGSFSLLPSLRRRFLAGSNSPAPWRNHLTPPRKLEK